MKRLHLTEIINIIVLLFALNSCIQEVTPDFSDFSNSLVVNSLLVPDSLMKIQLSESSRSDKMDIFPSYNNADVRIFNAEISVRLVSQGNGTYMSTVYPKQGSDYFLRITTSSGKEISAYTRIPDKPLITITPFTSQNLVQVNISDNSKEENYYWIGMKSFSISSNMMYYETYVSSDFIWFDDFNRTKGEDLLGDMSFSYHFYARLPDFKFNGSQVSFTLPHYWSNPEDYEYLPYRVYLYIINADEHLDKYMKSALIQYELGVIGDMPVFHTPIDMYSNIENGKGIFGSYTISQFDITTP